MSWDQIAGKWKRFAGSARERWGKLTNNNWEAFAGKKTSWLGEPRNGMGW